LEKLILEQIVNILSDNKQLMRIAIRQREKFEGWLKFELANRIEKLGFNEVEIETKVEWRRNRPDISFYEEDDFYRIELKTCNTSWKIDGISKKGKPITDNIKGVTNDAKKLNSNYGIVAFVMFPIPKNDIRWKPYIERIKEETKIEIDYKLNCKILAMEIDDSNTCDLLVCLFMSRKFNNWY
jgi:hypothetical protein